MVSSSIKRRTSTRTRSKINKAGFPETKIFDGNTYEYDYAFYGHNRSSNADDEVTRLRENGYYARWVELTNNDGYEKRKACVVYCRPKTPY